MRCLNLGILAHVDAGKTTLTERLLYAAGVIDALGSVDAGTTQTDTLALERQRGITIKTAVVSFVVDGVQINLIDTPGHPDFIAEVERALGVLDGAVLVISAVEGVQAQTRVLMRALQRLRMPALLFVNKIDRGGADPERVLQDIAAKLTPAVVALGAVREPGTRAASCTLYGADDAEFTVALVEALAEQDEALLATYVQDESAVSYRRLREALAAQSKRALVYPVFCGSAITGAGVQALIAALTELLPAVEGNTAGPVSGSVFKVERGPAGEKIAYVRMFSGTVHTRERLRFGRDSEAKVTAIRVFERGGAVQRAAVVAGQIAKLWGLSDVRIGDAIGGARPSPEQRSFAPPTLETVIVPRRVADRAALHAALAQLAEQDPLINLRQDDVRQELYVSLYGEVQKEVIEATLAYDYGLAVEFRETTPIYVERPLGVGAAVELLHAGSNPFLATVGLRVEPSPIDSGIHFRLDIELGSIPLYVYKSVDEFREAIAEIVRDTLGQGLYGWQVTDCTVTMTHSGYVPPGSTARDFRLLTPLVLMQALQQAGTVVCEPVHRVRIEAPVDSLAGIVRALARLGAAPHTSAVRGSSCVLEGEIAAGRVHALQLELRGLTRGEGTLESAFDHYQPVSGSVPTRPRTDLNPLNRNEYLLHLSRRY